MLLENRFHENEYSWAKSCLALFVHWATDKTLTKVFDDKKKLSPARLPPPLRTRTLQEGSLLNPEGSLSRNKSQTRKEKVCIDCLYTST